MLRVAGRSAARSARSTARRAAAPAEVRSLATLSRRQPMQLGRVTAGLAGLGLPATSARAFCSGAGAQAGAEVSVHYTGTFPDTGETFDSSVERGEAMSFTLGAGNMIAGFDAAVMGMSVGEKKTIVLKPNEAYGDHDPALVVELKKEQMPDGVSAGDKLQSSDGRQVTVISVEAEKVKLDTNHPMAGKTLQFEIELTAIAEKAAAAVPDDSGYAPPLGVPNAANPVHIYIYKDPSRCV